MRIASRVPPWRLAKMVITAVILVATCGDEATAQVGRVYGRVYDADSGQPIRGVTVTAENLDVSPPSFTAVSDNDGRYSMIGLRSGQWQVAASAPGYYRTSGATQVQQGITRAIPLDLRLRKLAPAPVSAFEKLDIGALRQDMQAADALVGASRLDEAVTAYSALLQKVPGLTAAHLQLGHVYRLKKDFAAAVAEYEKVLESDSAYGLAQVEMGLTELERGDLLAAERILAAAADSDAAGAETYYSLGEVKRAASDPSAASLWYEKARAADPAWPRPLVRLGQVAAERGDSAAAATYLKEAISLDPSGSDAADARALLSKIGP